MSAQQLTITNPMQPLKFPNGRSTLAVPAERREIVQSQQVAGGGLHRIKVELTRPRGDVARRLRHNPEGGGRKAVAVVAPQRRKPGIETVRSPADIEDPNFGREQPGQSAHQGQKLGLISARDTRLGVDQRGRLNVDMGDLTAGMDTGVGSASCTHLNR